MSREFTVGVALMSETLEHMSQFGRQAQKWCEELEERIAQLHVRWSGEAANA